MAKLIGIDEIKVAPLTIEDLEIWQRQTAKIPKFGQRDRYITAELTDVVQMVNQMRYAIASKTTHARSLAHAIEFLDG